MALQHLDTLIGLTVFFSGLSLVVTLSVQAVVALLALRGANLRWGLKTLLENFGGESLRAHARETAENVLCHPLLSDSLLSQDVGVPSRWRRRWTMAKAMRSSEFLSVLDKLANEPGQQSWRVALRAARSEARLTDEEISSWFDRTMDRAAQRFATWTRVIAIPLSFLLAAVLHLDVGRLYESLATDATLRGSGRDGR